MSPLRRACRLHRPWRLNAPVAPRSPEASHSSWRRPASPATAKPTSLQETQAGSEERRVGTYYFYIYDDAFGPGFIKTCTYFPYPGKVWLNGHEWAKRQARRAGLDFGELANGFSSCEDPAGLQRICDRFGPRDVQAFFDRWRALIPSPFTDADRQAGYDYELSMRQVEISRTLVFDDPRRARSFFEALVQDNIDVGRPEQIAAVFGMQLRTRGPRKTTGTFRTRVFSPGTEVKIDFSFKHSRVKQYLTLIFQRSSGTRARMTRQMLRHLGECGSRSLTVSRGEEHLSGADYRAPVRDPGQGHRPTTASGRPSGDRRH